MSPNLSFPCIILASSKSLLLLVAYSKLSGTGFSVRCLNWDREGQILCLCLSVGLGGFSGETLMSIFGSLPLGSLDPQRSPGGLLGVGPGPASSCSVITQRPLRATPSPVPVSPGCCLLLFPGNESPASFRVRENGDCSSVPSSVSCQLPVSGSRLPHPESL